MYSVYCGAAAAFPIMTDALPVRWLWVDTDDQNLRCLSHWVRSRRARGTEEVAVSRTVQHTTLSTRSWLIAGPRDGMKPASWRRRRERKRN